jgi:hypothetical protein
MHPTPRRLTTDQKAVLIQVLRTFPNQEVSVCYHPAASDALSYAQDFVNVFKVIGWTVNDGGPSGDLNDQSMGLAMGLVFLVSVQDGLPPGAEALRDSLRIYGIEVSTLCDPTSNISPSAFILAIGPQS